MNIDFALEGVTYLFQASITRHVRSKLKQMIRHVVFFYFYSISKLNQCLILLEDKRKETGIRCFEAVGHVQV